MGLLTIPNKAVSISNEVGCTAEIVSNVGPVELSPGGTAEYTISVTPMAPVWSVDVSVGNDSGTESPYVYTISGTVAVNSSKTRLFGGNTLDPEESFF